MALAADAAEKRQLLPIVGGASSILGIVNFPIVLASVSIGFHKFVEEHKGKSFSKMYQLCCEYAALRFLFAGSYVSAGIVQLKWGLSDGLTQGRQVSFLSIYDEAGPLFPR